MRGRGRKDGSWRCKGRKDGQVERRDVDVGRSRSRRRSGRVIGRGGQRSRGRERTTKKAKVGPKQQRRRERGSDALFQQLLPVRARMKRARDCLLASPLPALVWASSQSQRPPSTRAATAQPNLTSVVRLPLLLLLLPPLLLPLALPPRLHRRVHPSLAASRLPPSAFFIFGREKRNAVRLPATTARPLLLLLLLSTSFHPLLRPQLLPTASAFIVWQPGVGGLSPGQ